MSAFHLPRSMGCIDTLGIPQLRTLMEMEALPVPVNRGRNAPISAAKPDTLMGSAPVPPPPVPYRATRERVGLSSDDGFVYTPNHTDVEM